MREYRDSLPAMDTRAAAVDTSAGALRAETGPAGFSRAGAPARFPVRLPVTERPANLAWYSVAKGLVEWPLALLALAAALPLMALTAVAVKLSGPGPVIHRRRVLGVGGTPFDAFKFRTMVPDAEAVIRRDPGLLAAFSARHKLAEDPRITPVGRWLRKLSLDELPQLVNVLRGQMALVGPRMIAPDELVKYGPHGQKLLTVKPGLTGLWQVSGRQTTTYDRRVELDMFYIDNRSLVLDLAILARTPLVVIRGEGAH